MCICVSEHKLTGVCLCECSVKKGQKTTSATLALGLKAVSCETWELNLVLITEIAFQPYKAFYLRFGNIDVNSC